MTIRSLVGDDEPDLDELLPICLDTVWSSETEQQLRAHRRGTRRGTAPGPSGAACQQSYSGIARSDVEHRAPAATARRRRHSGRAWSAP